MRIAYVDTETTGTNPAIHELWEIAYVIEEDGREVTNRSFFVTPQRLEIAEPRALEIGGYWERKPDPMAFSGPFPDQVAEIVADELRDVRFASCNVAFDTAFVRAFLLEHRQPVTWHYSPIDVKSVCYGAWPETFGWKTDDLLRHAGRLEDDKRHEARHDAYMARHLLHDALMDHPKVLSR